METVHQWMFTLEVGRNVLAVCLLVNLCAFVRRVLLRQGVMKALRLAIGFECEPLLRGPTMGGVMVSTTTASEQSPMSMKEKAMFESTFLNFLIGGENFGDGGCR